MKNPLMEKEFDYLSFIKSLISFSPRQLEGERKAGNFIISILENHNIKYWPDYFFTRVPKIEKAVLKANGKEIPCRGCSFYSGKIKDKDYLISSLIPSRFFLDKSNINFNPKCRGISLSNFYSAPALAVSRKVLNCILKAKKIEGEIKVKPIKYKACNILVGNKENPKVICFAHYDSIEKGTVDNASGVAVMMATILSRLETLKKVLYVFLANEELSYDRPIYWGHSFRVFEDKFYHLLKRADKVLILDCLGNGPTKIYRDKNSIYLAFPIKNREKWQKKIFIISGDRDRLMSIYHSNLDDLKELKPSYLKEASKLLLSYVS